MNLDKIVNDLCREFRRIRDELADMAEDEFDQYIKNELNKFWGSQPLYLQLFRKPIMQFVYRNLKELF